MILNYEKYYPMTFRACVKIQCEGKNSSPNPFSCKEKGLKIRCLSNVVNLMKINLLGRYGRTLTTNAAGMMPRCDRGIP